jgi:hypothetical protein
LHHKEVYNDRELLLFLLKHCYNHIMSNKAGFRGTTRPRQVVTAGTPIILDEVNTTYLIHSDGTPIAVGNGILLPPTFDRDIVLINDNGSSVPIAIDQSTARSRCNIGGILRPGLPYRLRFRGGKRGTWNFIGGQPVNPVLIASAIIQETSTTQLANSVDTAGTVSQSTLSVDAGNDVDIDQTGTGNINFNAASGDINIGVGSGDTLGINIAADIPTGGGPNARTITFGSTSTTASRFYECRPVSINVNGGDLAANTTLTAAQSGTNFAIDTSGGSVTVDLPDATTSPIGCNYILYKGVGANPMIIDSGPGSGTLEGIMKQSPLTFTWGQGNTLLTMTGSSQYDYAKLELIVSGVWSVDGYVSGGATSAVFS